VKAARDAWAADVLARAAELAARLVFIDETGCNTKMARTHGRAPPGERVPGRVPHGHWRTLTVIGAVRLDGTRAAMTVGGGTDAAAFGTFLDFVLAPALRPGDVVVMDNLAAHKVAAVRETVEAAGATVLYLPPYSPDLNPIEKMWSKVKQLLRSAAARTKDALEAAIAAALAAVTADDCRGWFESCGYIVN
jgi:transposase